MYRITDTHIEKIYDVTHDEFTTLSKIISPNGALLDVGTGGGRYARKSLEIGFCPVVGLDIDSHRVEYCRVRGVSEHLMYLQGDILNPPAFGFTFGTIVAMTDTFSFLADQKRMLQSCRNLLHNNGSVYISLTYVKYVRDLYRDIYDEPTLRMLEERNPSPEELADLFVACGLKPSLLVQHTCNKMFIMCGTVDHGSDGFVA